MAPPDGAYIDDDTLDTEEKLRTKFAELQRRMARVVLPARPLSDAERGKLRYEIEVLEASIEEVEWWAAGSGRWDQ